MSTVDRIHANAPRCELGESPVWSANERALYWVDIPRGYIHRFHPETEAHVCYRLPEDVGCIGLRAQGGFIAGLRSGIYLLSDDGMLERRIALNPNDRRYSRFNDGRVDPWGRFWAGTMWEPRDRNEAVLICVDAQHRTLAQRDDLMVSNGVAFSPDRRWLFHSDTPNRVLYRYPLDRHGMPGCREVVRRFPVQMGLGRPDGGTFDKDGCYWSAQYEGGALLRMTVGGDVIARIDLPVRYPTMPAFGGPDMRTLYITTAADPAPEASALSGAVLALRVDVPGCPEPLFAG